MIVTASQILASAIVWLGAELHGWAHGHAQATQQRIDTQIQYCKPVDQLPDAMPQWKIDERAKDCAGVREYMLEKPNVKLMAVPVKGGQ